MSIKVTVLGSGTPLPNLQRAGPAFVAHLSDEPILIDCGPDTLGQMMLAKVWASLQDHHSTPENAGRIAAAGVKKLVLIHLQPSADPMEVVQLASTTFAGEILAAEDLLEIQVA